MSSRRAARTGKSSRSGSGRDRSFSLAGKPGPGLESFVRVHGRTLLILLLCVVAIHGRSLWAGFTDWDDNLNVYQNPGITDWNWSRFAAFWTAPYGNLYVPLVYTSYLFDRAVSWGIAGGLVPAVFHATNVLLHMAAVGIVFVILLRLGATGGAAMVGAAVFALHPLQVESVAWITGRKDVLSGALTLLAVERFLAFATGGKPRVYAVATVAFVLALLAKPSAMTTPALVAAVLLFLPASNWRSWAKWLAPWFIAGALWFLVTRWSQEAIGPESGFWVPWWKRPFVASDAVLFYLAKVVWPSALVPIHPVHNATLFQNPLVWLSPAPLILLMGVLAWRSRRGAYCLLVFLVPIIPVLGFAQFFFQFHSNVADRYVYVSMLGVSMAVAMAIRRLPVEVWRRGAVAACAVMAMLSFKQIGYWKSAESLWTRQLEVVPFTPQALFNLGGYRSSTGDTTGALELYRRLAEAEPNEGRVYPPLIRLLAETGQTTESTGFALKALQLPPHTVDNFVAIGEAQLFLKQYARAAEAFRGAVFGLPGDAELRALLARALMESGDAAGAEASAVDALQLNPRVPQAHAVLGELRFRQGRIAEALEHLRIAVQLNPTDSASKARLDEAVRLGSPSKGTR